MNSSATKLSVLLLLAVAWTASAQRRGIRTCSCQVGNGQSQQGKLVGRVCYVVGVGTCRSFTYEGSSQQQQQQQSASQRRFSQHRQPFRSRFQSRFDTNGPSRFNANHQTQFNTRQNQFNPNRQTQFNPNRQTQFNTNRQTQFNTNRQTQFNTNRQAQFNTNRQAQFGSGRFGIAEAAATASPEQHRSAAEETRRQLENRRTYERELLSAGVTVRPGTPEAAQASERKPDEKSADLGNKALAQILYLQSLLGRNGRR